MGIRIACYKIKIENFSEPFCLKDISHGKQALLPFYGSLFMVKRHPFNAMSDIYLRRQIILRGEIFKPL
ncbi:MAG: hypothetical protein A4E56_00834 [Pelotomaculum sp. PtaU1.Bin065]|nr:MAG: hypothetical protein A4E56_00834 [Pelotomaculum sp. PtaU1.Bin065]